MKKKKTNIIKSIFAIAMAASLTACSSASAGSSAASAGSSSAGSSSADPTKLDTSSLVKPTLDTSDASGVLKNVLDSGTLTVATSPDYPPNEWVDDSGTIYGFEMMMAKYVADCLGVKLKIETSDFAGTFVAVDTGKADIAFSGYGWKKDRAESYELSNGYISDPDSPESKHTLITTSANADKYHSLSDFVGSHIMAQANSLQEMYVQDEILSLDKDGTTDYEAVSTLDQAILGLASGKCDAVALDESHAENYVASSDGQFVMTNVYFDLTPYGDYQGNVALAKKGETSLMNAVNECLKTAADNGYITEWYQTAKKAAGIEDTDE